MTSLRAVALAAASWAAVFAPSAGARTLEVGAGRAFATPSAAVAVSGPGDHIVVDPGQYFDCAILANDHLVIEGSGDPALIVMSDKACQGKALLVITGNDVTVRNLTLTRVRVADGNGAGIRAEGDQLTVDGVRFINNQDGILTDANPAMHVLVRNSRFIRNGVCLDYCSHAIYAGHIAELIVQNSYFRDTRDGHDVKSRAARTEITGCDIADGPDGTSSYLIEAPNGGTLIVTGNRLEKGPKSGNHTAAISIGAEGVSQATPEILVEGNHFTNDGDFRTAFVNNVTATEARLRGNILSGPVDALRGDGSSE